MDPMEEMMAGLFGEMGAPGVGGGPGAFDDPRRRRMLAGDGGYQGGSIAGPEATLARLLPYLMGAGFPNQAGLPGNLDLSGLSLDLRNAVGGPNVAPGSPGGQSINQPTPTPVSVSVNAGPGQMPGGGGGAPRVPGLPGGIKLPGGGGGGGIGALISLLGGGR